MCGIAGQVRIDGRPVDREAVAAMGAALRHRGPDDQGVHVAGHVGLAHRRLSVLDVSDAGRQPMANAAGTVRIVFNGEIYNFEELRRRVDPARPFRSRTDTEVLLALYEEYGLDCLAWLRGMFAFAIWDEPAQRLVLARDRLGKKPLFYAHDQDGIRFASELKALLLDDPTPPVDPLALHHYLTFQYVPAPLTIFQGIRKLLPGHVLIYEKERVAERPYWALRYDVQRPRRRDEDYRQELLALLTESIRLRLVSDVPLGAFLSGGVDSSTVVALMSRLTDRPVQTFSIGFKEEAFNELPYARAVAERFGTDHHEFVVEPAALDILPKLVRVYDEPFADSSAIPTYYVSELSRRFVTVALNGDGGDELLAGYPRYALTGWDRAGADWLSPRIRERLGRWVEDDRLPISATLRQGLGRACRPFARTYLGRICYFSPAEKARLYQSEFAEQVAPVDSYDLLAERFDRAPASDLLNRLLWVDTMTYLPDDLLVKVDRATMAHGLEARSPFLDHRLMEWAAALPADLKVRHGQGKFLLKWAMRGLLPDQVLDRPKMGFGVPIDRWFRDECRDFVRETLLSSRAVGRGYFRRAVVEEWLDRHQRAGENNGYRLYALLMLELWHREYADRREAGALELAGAR